VEQRYLVNREQYDLDLVEWTAVRDIGMIYINWAKAHVRVMYERGEADFSALDDLATEIMEHSSLYVKRLRQLEVVRSGGLAYIRDVMLAAIAMILDAAESLCEIARLTGGWDEKDEETRLYWLGKTGAAAMWLSIDPSRADDRPQVCLPYAKDCGGYTLRQEEGAETPVATVKEK